MNSEQHLLPEDRPEFERVLGEALRTASRRPDLAAIGQRLNSEQLRTMALAAAAAISACAAAEYQHYVKLRGELRAQPSAVSRPGAKSGDGEPRSSVGLATAMGEAAEASGAGFIAVFAVLAPVLAASAAVIFLAIGYLLHMVSPDTAVAEQMILAGWVFGALTAFGIIVAMGGLLLTALRDGSGSLRAAGAEEASTELAQAREAWREALLERGVLPFLREALANPAAVRRGDTSYHREVDDHGGRTPQLGYSRPGFSSPNPGADSNGRAEEKTRPSFKSPGFSSPDYGGPEHQPD